MVFLCLNSRVTLLHGTFGAITGGINIKINLIRYAKIPSTGWMMPIYICMCVCVCVCIKFNLV